MIFTRALDAVYHRVDLYGPDGRPAQTKVLTAVGFFAGLALVGSWGTIEAVKTGAVSETTAWTFCGVLLLAFGLDGIKTIAKVRLGARDPVEVPATAPMVPAARVPHASLDAQPTDATAGELLPPVAQSRPLEDV